jgi:predicted aspartyl protease
MLKFGMIVDCARQMLYIDPNGPSSSVSQSLASFLSNRGFTRVPLRLNANHHFDVEATLNGHGTRFIVDTGAATTLIDKETAVRSGTTITALWGVGGNGAGGLHGGLGRASVKQLEIGSFKLANSEVAVAHVSADILLSKSAAESNAGVLGQEYLSSNFAIIDVGGRALYLRHPDSR